MACWHSVKGEEGGGAEKTTGGGAGDRREGWRVLARGQNCFLSVCVCQCRLECVVRLSKVVSWQESERCHHSKWFKTLWVLGSFQVRAPALYRIPGYRDIALSTFLFSAHSPLSARTWLCLFLCLVGARTVWQYDPMGKISGPEGVAVMWVTSMF